MGKVELKHCAGCRDDFYNDRNPLGVKQCWSFKSARLVTRYQIGTWIAPTEPGAFREVEVPNCYHATGKHFCKELPDFVKVEDVINHARAKYPRKAARHG